MNWRRRGAKVLGSYLAGYGGGIGVEGLHHGMGDLSILFTIPAIAGLIVALPQMGKMFNEFSKMDP